MKEKFLRYPGVELYCVGHTEKLVSGLGAFFGISLVFYTSTCFVQGSSSFLIVASMGASAVLLFTVPHDPLSQPWPLIGGHLVSAVIGVTGAGRRDSGVMTKNEFSRRARHEVIRDVNNWRPVDEAE